MNYSIKLAAYEGPLDLLLALISKAKIEIKDIFVSEITEQYLEYISGEGVIDMDSASDFVQMAATLLYIKSRALLPHANEDLDEDGLTPEERLIKKLNAYKAFKEAGEKLRVMEQEGFKQYFKLPEEVLEEVREEIYINADKNMLMQFMVKLMEKKPAEKQHFAGVTVIQDTYSIREQIKLIIARLAIKPTMTFTELISDSPSREEVAVTFMSLLELVNKNKVSVSQEKIFGDILVTRQ